MTGLEIRDVGKTFGHVEVLSNLNLQIRRGEFVVFVGPSGCGKSTLLRMIAGLEEVSTGVMRLNGVSLNDLPAADRGMAMVFQSYALYPHMTVYENMAFGLKIKGVAKPEIDIKVRRAATALQLTSLLERRPKSLSGGQRQRVAIGRAICRDPEVFLFDEPLSNLDASLRAATRVEIARLKQTMPDATMIYVTHDQVEAMTLADRIVVLSGGRIEQVGTPMELYRSPATLFVARFVGSPAMNVMECRLDSADCAVRAALGNSRFVTFPPGRPIPESAENGFLGIRPEHLHLARGEDFLLEGRVALQEELGESTQLYVETDASDDPVIVKLPGSSPDLRGSLQRLNADVADMHMFDSAGRALPRGVIRLLARST